LARFRIPSLSRRRISMALSIAVLILAGMYVYARSTCCTPPAPGIAAEAMQQFKNTCTREARHANGGGDLAMDEDTEAKIGAYCGCVADGLSARVPPLEVAKIADGTMSDETIKKLDAIVADCRAKLE
jgi:hypothetical protein